LQLPPLNSPCLQQGRCSARPDAKDRGGLRQPDHFASIKHTYGKERSAPLDAGLLSAELYLAEPIREGAAYPRQRNYHGYYWMASTRAHVWHESLHERDWLMRLDFAGDIVALASQPMKLTGSDGVIHYPDFLALDARGVQTVYDVKPAARINAKARAQFEWTRDLCQDVGWDYRVLADISAQERVNLLFLSQFRHPNNHPGTEPAQELASAAQPGWTINDATRQLPAASTALARRGLFHLMWTRTFTADLTQRLSGRTPLDLGTTAG